MSRFVVYICLELKKIGQNSMMGRGVFVRRFFLAFFPLVSCVLFLSACFAPQNITPVYSRTVAEVGNIKLKEDLIRARVQLELGKYPRDFLKDYKGGPVKDHPLLSEIFHKIFDKMVEDAIIVEYGKRHELVLKDFELAKKIEQYISQNGQRFIDDFLVESGLPYNRWREILEDRFQTQNVLDKELGPLTQVSLAEIQNYYNKNSSEFEIDEQVRVRHIVTDSKAKAEEILKRLQKGENFAKVAINHSLSPDRAKGGDLGYFAKGSFPKIFDETCFKLAKGEISPVVKSDYGWHIFKLLDKKSAGTKKLVEVAGQIQQKLMQDKMARLYPKWIEKLRKEIPVKIDQDILQSFTL